MKYLFNVVLITICLSANILAQSQATLQGKVIEAKTGDDAINAYIKLLKGNDAKMTVATDYEGSYTLHIDPGTYDVEITYIGMATQLIKGVVLNGGRITKVDVKLETDAENRAPIVGLTTRVSTNRDAADGMKSTRKEGTVYFVDGVPVQKPNPTNSDQKPRKKRRFWCKKQAISTLKE